MAEKSVPRPTLREIEVVIKDGTQATFTEAVKTKLLQNLAKISMGAVSDYVITRVVEGSLHVFAQMPLDDSYELPAKALNRDPHLLAADISAIRYTDNAGCEFRANRSANSDGNFCANADTYTDSSCRYCHTSSNGYSNSNGYPQHHTDIQPHANRLTQPNDHTFTDG